MTKQRLLEPFDGFDSMDPKMLRIPNDLNDETIRKEYLENHRKWFFKSHDDALKEFENEVANKYGNKVQMSMFDV